MVKIVKLRNPKGKERVKLLRDIVIDYKDIDLLTIFTDIYGRIVPRRYTGLSVSQQKNLARAIKRSRFMGLMPFVK
jgi:small subunit ribosomal protein S18